ncbi:MAG TPA: hypothetical protein VFC72_00110 [Corynebacterium sp.]|nr:hypothetical protein [Corynebacterium sp.]
MSDSGNIQIDYEGARQRLGQARELGRAELAAHLSRRPDFSPAAAGRDFQSYGEHIAALLHQVHETGRRQVDSVITVAQAGIEQVDAVQGADAEFGAHLGRPLR